MPETLIGFSRVGPGTCSCDGHPVLHPPPMASAGSLQGTQRSPGSGLGILRLVSTMEEDSLIDVHWHLSRGKEEAASPSCSASVSQEKRWLKVLQNAQANPRQEW